MAYPITGFVLASLSASQTVRLLHDPFPLSVMLKLKANSEMQINLFCCRTSTDYLSDFGARLYII
jgi:hypothetical protein